MTSSVSTSGKMGYPIELGACRVADDAVITARHEAAPPRRLRVMTYRSGNVERAAGVTPDTLAEAIALQRLSALCQQKRLMHRSKMKQLIYSITSSARASSDGGIVRPSALAVLRLMTSSNFVGCSTGRSPGLAPLRILST